MTTRPPLRDRLYAQGAAWATRHPLVRGVLEGGDIAPVRPIGFHVSRTTADELPDLAKFSGVPFAEGRRRRDLPVGAMAVHSEVLDEELLRAGGERAVVWALGRSVLVGAIPKADQDAWALDPTIGMRVGLEELLAAPAIWRPDNTVVVRPDSFERVLPYRDTPNPYYNNPREADEAGVLVY